MRPFVHQPQVAVLGLLVNHRAQGVHGVVDAALREGVPRRHQPAGQRHGGGPLCPVERPLDPSSNAPGHAARGQEGQLHPRVGDECHLQERRDHGRGQHPVERSLAEGLGFDGSTHHEERHGRHGVRDRVL